MSIQTLSYHAFLVEMDWLFDKLNAFVARIGWTLASHEVSVPRTPRRIGTDVLPFYFAGDMRVLFDFARGQRETSVDFVEDTIETLLEVLLSTPLQRHRPRADRADLTPLDGRPLGVIIRGARARAALLDERWPRLVDVEALTGLSSDRLQRLGVELETRDEIVCCAPDGVEKLLDRMGPDDEEL